MGVAVLALYDGSLANDTKSDWFRGLTRCDVLPPAVERLILVIWLALFLLGGLAPPAT